MQFIKSAILYTALAFGANAVVADSAELEALREGNMKKLQFHSEPRVTSETVFFDEADAEFTLADFKGDYVVLNFWATWCAPCRKEMPSLSNLQTHFEDDPVNVVTVATGRNPVPAMKMFFKEIDVDNLPLLRDPKQKLARDMGVLGLPITVILDPDGKEIARLQGDAEWDSESAIAIIEALVAKTGS